MIKSNAATGFISVPYPIAMLAIDATA